MSTNSSVSEISLSALARAITPVDETDGVPDLQRESDGDTVAPRKEPRDAAELKRARLRQMSVAAALMLVAIALVAVLGSFAAEGKSSSQPLVFYTVEPRDLPIQVVERGTLESQNNVQVLCEVDDVYGDGISGTPILWIIENGSNVEKGDLLVELDSASQLERLDGQLLDTEEARLEFTQAKIQYENRLSRNETLKAQAELDLEIAGLELKQYEDEQGGTYQLELQDVELDIEQRVAQLEINARNMSGTEQLFGLGYKSRGDRDQARLRALEAESALKREKSRQRELTVYDYVRSRRVLEGALESAQRKLIQVERDNVAMEAQAKARLDSEARSLDREEERLTRYREQLERCKIYAPQSGMVAYHVETSRRSSSATIGEGTPVQARQKILSIPNLTLMQVSTAVHESVVDRVKAGMRASVRIDAFPGREYTATVDTVSVLPDPGGWMSSDTKVYKTIVRIDEEVKQIKPGMTAVAEIHIDQLYDVLAVPVQAVVQRGEDNWCFCSQDGQIRKCVVELGKTNDKFVEIRGGLKQGDQVVLNPSAILGEDPDRPQAGSTESTDEKRESDA